MRIRTVLGCLMLASLSCGCAARLPVGPDAMASPVYGSSSDAVRSEAWSPFLQAETSAPYTACYVRPVADFERHKLNVFLGWTGERGGGGATVGLDYEWRISELFGVEVFADRVSGDVDAYAFGALAAFHPWKGLVLFAGPGIDLDVEEEEGATELEFGKAW